jgi:hypothetical protein
VGKDIRVFFYLIRNERIEMSLNLVKSLVCPLVKYSILGPDHCGGLYFAFFQLWDWEIPATTTPTLSPAAGLIY